MAKEVKFRGKRLDNGEWVYGSLRKFTEDAQEYFYIMPFDRWGSGFEVDPTTVGEFTGLEDKNGVEIYEEDIISDQASMVKTMYEVYWHEPSASYWAKLIEPGVATGEGNNLFHYRGWCEVIGNIYENPELLNKEVHYEE